MIEDPDPYLISPPTVMSFFGTVLAIMAVACVLAAAFTGFWWAVYQGIGVMLSWAGLGLPVSFPVALVVAAVASWIATVWLAERL